MLCVLFVVSEFSFSKTYSVKVKKIAMTSSVQRKRWMNTAKIVGDMEHCRRLEWYFWSMPMNFPEKYVCTHTNTNTFVALENGAQIFEKEMKRYSSHTHPHPHSLQAARSLHSCTWIAYFANDNSISVLNVIWWVFIYFFVCGLFSVLLLLLLLALGSAFVFTSVCLKCVRISDLDSGVLWAVQMLCGVCRFTISLLPQKTCKTQ